jgi:FG-GAP-like repeat
MSLASSGRQLPVLDGDGLKDIVIGKRWWSHGDNYGSPEAQAAPVLYWFKLVRKPGGQMEFVPHLINNNSGVGTQIVAIDMNGDGKPDILSSARKGAFIFFNNINNKR